MHPPGTHSIRIEIIYLKDAFFCLQLAPSSQPLFAFQWENPTTGAKKQFTWTRLPPGFKNSPTLFSGALALDLSNLPGQDAGSILLQYVDNFLLASSTQTQCWEGTQSLLRLLTETVPSTQRQILEFLGAAGFCRIWIPGFSDLAKPLYEGEENAPINWEQQGSPRSSDSGVGTLAEANSLPLQTDWPSSLRSKRQTSSLWDKTKVLHAVITLMEAKRQHWLTHAQMTQYQGLLCENSQIRLEAVRTLNPATFLPITRGNP
ncbi:hypothetical protein QTO34_014244 [Cnephaeus nilssonii]|uniref:Reverse transcriptase domain-containing protein n=1 Tax=Cnephaeus nilssonii TaxID=3371016 RepID=A0AA40I669_CNENI|nr:hypothetical protein QTO34_014244 [Eptesicus nilssonii]